MQEGVATDRGDAGTRAQVLRLASLAIALVALSLALRAASFVDAPLDRDEGAYALIAQQWRRGATLYGDYFDHKPPLVYVAYRLVFAVAGEHLAAVRTLFALLNACTAFACAVVVRRLTSRREIMPPVLAGVAACVFLNSPLVQGEIANTESLMGLGTVGAGWLIVRATQRGHTADALLAGICAGFAILAKPVAIFEAAFFATWLAIHAVERPADVRRFAAGLLVPSLAWGVYALSQGTLVTSIDTVLLYNVRYAGSSAVPLWARVAALPIDYGVPLALLWAGVAGCTLTALRREPQPANFALGWTAAAVVGTLASGRIYDHYYQQLIPPMAVALGVSSAAMGALTRARWMRLASCIAVAFGLWPPLAAARSFASEAANRGCSDWQTRLAAVIRTLTAPDDLLFTWGAEPYLNFAATRRPPGRFIYKYPLLGDSSASDAARRSLFAAWDEQPPAVIVIVKREATAEAGRSAATEIIASDAPFHRLLSRFAPALETPDFVLYTRNDSSPLPWQARWEQTRPDGCS